MDINARLEKLEGENRRINKIGIVAAVVVSMFIVGGQVKTSKVVEANEFRLVDASGKVLASPGHGFSQPALLISSPNGEADVYSATNGTNPFLIMGPSKAKKGASLNPQTLLIDSPSGAFSVDMGGPIPSLTVEDNEGFSSVLGGSSLVITRANPGSFSGLFGKDKKVLWSAP